MRDYFIFLNPNATRAIQEAHTLACNSRLGLAKTRLNLVMLDTCQKVESVKFLKNVSSKMQYNWINSVSKNTAVDQILRLLFKSKTYLYKYS